MKIKWNMESRADAVVRRFIDAQSAQDTAGILACLAEDYVRYGEESGWLPIGKQHYQAMADNFIAAFGDFSWDVSHKVTAGDTVAFGFIESGVFCREWDLLGLKVTPNNGRYRQRTAMVCKINRQGLIQSYSYTHDRAFMNVFAHVIADAGAIASIPEAPDEAPPVPDDTPQPTRAIEDCSPGNAAEAIVLRLGTALSRCEFDAVRQCLADNFKWESEETGWQPVHRDWACELAAAFGEAFPDHSWEIIDLLSEDDTVAVEIVETGTFSRPWHRDGRVIEPNHGNFRSHAVIFFEVNEDGLISLARAVHDGDFRNCYGEVDFTPGSLVGMGM